MASTDASGATAAALSPAVPATTETSSQTRAQTTMESSSQTKIKAADAGTEAPTVQSTHQSTNTSPTQPQAAGVRGAKASSRDASAATKIEPFPRASGVLIHISSLPGAHGIGDLGRSCHDLLDWLAKAKQRYWQILPLQPLGAGDSPYAPPSAMASNPLFIDLELLVEKGLLTRAQLAPLAALPKDRVDYARLTPAKMELLRLATARFDAEPEAHATWHMALDAFAATQGPVWLDDFALYMALSAEHGATWTGWPVGLRDRDPEALAAARKAHAKAIREIVFMQFLIDLQWATVRAHAKRLGIAIVGDIPIFVGHASADVWAHRSLFKLDAAGQPLVVAGVPPDYFSETGQLWGNPLYDWKAHADEGYTWWTRRFERALAHVDVVRVDHFRGFEAAWEVPADATTAIHGEWVPGPGIEFFRGVDKRHGACMPIIAEDLGEITPGVRQLMADTGYPGMKVLQFGFDDPHNPGNEYLPHNYTHTNSLVYTGTHDSDTVVGWYLSQKPRVQRLASAYMAAPLLQQSPTSAAAVQSLAWGFVRSAMQSRAHTCITPLQDLLGLDGTHRMNRPGTATGNWAWRALPDHFTPHDAERLAALTRATGRCELDREAELKQANAEDASEGESRLTPAHVVHEVERYAAAAAASGMASLTAFTSSVKDTLNEILQKDT